MRSRASRKTWSASTAGKSRFRRLKKKHTSWTLSLSYPRLESMRSTETSRRPLGSPSVIMSRPVAAHLPLCSSYSSHRSSRVKLHCAPLCLDLTRIPMIACVKTLRAVRGLPARTNALNASLPSLLLSCLSLSRSSGSFMRTRRSCCLLSFAVRAPPTKAEDGANGSRTPRRMLSRICTPNFFTASAETPICLATTSLACLTSLPERMCRPHWTAARSLKSGAGISVPSIPIVPVAVAMGSMSQGDNVSAGRTADNDCRSDAPRLPSELWDRIAQLGVHTGILNLRDVAALSLVSTDSGGCWRRLRKAMFGETEAIRLVAGACSERQGAQCLVDWFRKNITVLSVDDPIATSYMSYTCDRFGRPVFVVWQQSTALSAHWVLLLSVDAPTRWGRPSRVRHVAREISCAMDNSQMHLWSLATSARSICRSLSRLIKAPVAPLCVASVSPLPGGFMPASGCARLCVSSDALDPWACGLLYGLCCAAVFVQSSMLSVRLGCCPPDYDASGFNAGVVRAWTII